MDILDGLSSGYILILLNGSLAAVFLTSSLPKLRQPRAFIVAVQAYHLLPQPWVHPLAGASPRH